MKTLFTTTVIICLLLVVLYVKAEAHTYEKARNLEQQAIQYQNDKDYNNATRNYKEATEWYEKVNNTAKSNEMHIKIYEIQSKIDAQSSEL